MQWPNRFAPLVSIVALLAMALPSKAQLVPDMTLGTEQSTVLSETAVRGDVADLIEGGAARGANLFHSFTEFGVLEGQRVYFANPSGIDSILTRVTGRNPSGILGTLGVDGAADLWLINPNGIVFGENALLDVSGSFYGTTAAAVEVGDGSFSAIAPEQSELLSVNPTVSFWNYLTEGSGDVVSQAQLAAGGELVLAGRNLDLQGQVAAVRDVALLATDAVQIRDTTAMPFVGYAGGELLVQGNQQVDIVALSHPESGLFAGGDMLLRSADAVGGDAHFWSGGDFRVETLAGEAGKLWSPVDPIIRSFGDVNISEYRGASLHILAGGSVNIGTAIINTPETGALGIDYLQDSVALADGTIVKVDGGAQPTLDIRAGMVPEAIGTPPIENLTGFNLGSDLLLKFVTSEVPTRADITVGDVLIDEPNGLVLLTNHYAPNLALAGGNIFVTGKGLYGNGINAQGLQQLNDQGGSVSLASRGDISFLNSFISTAGGGNVGDIVIAAEGTVNFDSQDGSFTGAESSLAPGTDGTGGSIRINANSVELRNGAQLRANTLGNGDAGNVVINAQDHVVFDGVNADSQLFSAAASIVGANARGSGGDVEINANSVEVTNGARLTSSTLGNGNAGDVLIEAKNRVFFNGTSTDSRFHSSVDSSAGFGAQGTGGNVEIRANFVEVANGAILSSDTVSDASGGNVEIRANSVEIADSAILSSSTFGDGNAGDILIEAKDSIVFDTNSITTSTTSNASGAGGIIRIIANSVDVTNGAMLSSSTFGKGNAGSVLINAQDHFVLDGRSVDGLLPSSVSSDVAFGAIGTGGNVEISANSVKVTNGASLSSSTLGDGDAGNIVINAQERVTFDGTSANGQLNSTAISSVSPRSTGTGGNILINTTFLDVTNGAHLVASTLGNGDAGNIVINARNRVVFDGTGDDGRISSAAISGVVGGMGNGGNIEISANSIEVTDGAQLLASTLGNGNAGNIVVNAQDSVVFDGSSDDGRLFSSALGLVQLGARGTGANIRINANSVELSNGANLSANTGGSGDAGNIEIIAHSLGVTNGSSITASTFKDGDAGNVIITAQDSVVFDGISRNGQSRSLVATTVEEGAIGTGGNVEISANSVEVINGARLTASSLGNGNAGNIVIHARDLVIFNGTSTDGQSLSIAASGLGPNATGVGGDVEINASSVEITNGALLTSSTLGSGNAGNIVINAQNRILVDGTDANGESSSSIASTVESGATGSGGKVEVNTHSLEIANGALITANTAGAGSAGDVVINAAGFVNIDGFTLQGIGQGFPSGIFTRNFNIDDFGTGQGGDVSITTPRLALQNGAIIDARTANNEPGGDIAIAVNSLALLQGGQILTTSDGSGPAGTININAADQVQISGSDPNFSQRVASFPSVGNDFQPQSNISVRSRASGSAGNIFINAPAVSLDEQGQIIAESATVDGGNINLDLGSRLILRNGSQITATAGTAQGAGNGGNVTINAPFIVAIPTEDSDITANAFQGSGGKVSITAEGVFGIEPRTQRTPLSDITASSELGVNGVVAFNALDTSFISSNLSELSENLVNTDTLVANSCIARSNANGALTLNNSEDLSQQPNSSQATYSLGSVQTIPTWEEANNSSVLEPQAIYRLADGRLVMSRDCSGS